MLKSTYSTYKLLVIVAILVVSCVQKDEIAVTVQADSSSASDQSNYTNEIQTIDIANMSDEDWLLFGGTIPTGISYDQTKEYLPSLGERRATGNRPYTPGVRLNEAYADVVFAGVPTRIVFGFKHDTLYAYHFEINNIDSATTVRVGHWILEFYTERFGDYKHETEAFEYFINDHYLWETKNGSHGLTINIYSTTRGYIGWGWP